jgi:hypothetical protein
VTKSEMANADFFKPGTSKSMRDGELDARIGIITEHPPAGPRDPPRHHQRGDDAKLIFILYSQADGFRSAGPPEAVPNLVRRGDGDAALCQGNFHQSLL